MYSLLVLPYTRICLNLCVATVLFKNRLIPFYSSGLTGTHHAKKTKKLIAYSLDIHYTAAALLALKIDANSILKLSRTDRLRTSLTVRTVSGVDSKMR